MFKYQGGKRREWKYIEKYICKDIETIVEPFCGGAAVSWMYGKNAEIYDTNSELIRVYKAVRDLEIEKILEELEVQKPDEDLYYFHRDRLNKKKYNTELEFLISWIYVRQQCYSGLVRYNSKGEFNTPWGRYKNFPHNITPEHQKMLKKWKIECKPFQESMKNIKPNSFVFLDPPYFKRNSNYKINQTEDEKLHIDLANILQKASYPYLLIHCDCDLYRDLYDDKLIWNKDHRYSLQFGSYDMTQAKVNHLYISNVKSNEAYK